MNKQEFVEYPSPCACPIGGLVLDANMCGETPKRPDSWRGEFLVPVMCESDDPSPFSETTPGKPVPMRRFRWIEVLPKPADGITIPMTAWLRIA